MTLARDLAWQNLELTYRSSVAYQFARYALGLKYESLPPEVVHQAKRCLLDALGCAIGAYDAPGRPICESLAQELGGPEEATLFGSGRRTSALSATLTNSFLVRFLDSNDLGGGGHNSDAIAGIIAVSEREKCSGPDLLTSLVVSYELGARVVYSFPGGYPAWTAKGWTTDVRAGLTMPPALGRLMGLNEDQVANAIGICTSHGLPLNILDADREENVMAKNIRFGWVVYDAILSCMLARKGFTGPVRVVEGDCGFRQVILQNEMDLERLVDFSGWRILQTRHKFLCLNATTQGHVYATMMIAKEHDLKPEDIAAVRVKVSLREWRHTTTPAKKYPRNAESADHSSFYGNAIAIKDRSFGPEAFEPGKFTDPVVLDLIEKITVEPDLSIPELSHRVVSEVVTKDGRRFQKRLEGIHGLDDDPLTDQELEEKFRRMAERHMSGGQANKLLDTIWNFDRVNDARKLARLMVFGQR